MIRTHDVGPTLRALRLWERIELARRALPSSHEAKAATEAEL